MPDQYAMQDPTTRYPAPSREQQPEIPHPGLTNEMSSIPSIPDHGEHTYRGSGRLRGRRAIITGADSGIGRAVAIAFAREGADVVLSYLDVEESDARETVRWIEEADRKAITMLGDIRSEEHCSALVYQGVDALGVLPNPGGPLSGLSTVPVVKPFGSLRDLVCVGRMVAADCRGSSIVTTRIRRHRISRTA